MPTASRAAPSGTQRTLLVAPDWPVLHDHFALIADDANFGNARRLFEGMRKVQSQRLRTLGRMPDMDELRTLTAADVLACVG